MNSALQVSSAIGFVRPLPVDLGPVRVASADRQTALRWVESKIADDARCFFCFCEANLLFHAAKNPEIGRVLDKAEAVFADGIALTLLARIRGNDLPERVPGPSFLLAACEHGVARGWRHFFYGGAPGIADALAVKLREKYPGIQIAGTCSPPFRPLTGPEEAETKAKIEGSGTDLLWVGLGGPKQEFWCAEHLGKIDVPVMLAVGAAFDFHSGNRPWAPAWIRRIGMEWVYRMFTGGRRTFLRNLRCVSVVAWLLIKEMLKVEKLKSEN